MKKKSVLILIIGLLCFSGCVKNGNQELGNKQKPTPMTLAKLDLSKWQQVESSGHSGTSKLAYSDQDGHRRVIWLSSQGTIIQDTIKIDEMDGRILQERAWYDNGQLKSEFLTKNSLSVKNVKYHENGEKEKESVYRDGKISKSYAWNSAGQMILEDIYDDKGKYVSAKRWYDDGTLKYEAKFESGKIIEKIFYNPDGTVKLKKKGR